MLEMRTEQRVTNLEELMAQVLRTVDRVDRQVERTSREMRVFQNEMDSFKNEMRVFKNEMRDFKNEMGDFKDEMSSFKNEINKKWGDLANKMGTMAEDLVAPSVPRVLRQTVGCPNGHIESQAVRVQRTHPADKARSREFDVVAVCGQYVLINETKSRLNARDVEDFVHVMQEAREFFPEYADKTFIGALASLHVDQSVARYGEKQGLIMLGFGERMMDVLNTSGFRPQEF
jgi:hypothetical protein